MTSFVFDDFRRHHVKVKKNAEILLQVDFLSLSLVSFHFCLLPLDTKFNVEQPMECLKAVRKFPHQYMTSPENSCGHYKWMIYNSPQHRADSWADALEDL
jgi:hypothetical protein